MFDGDVNLSVTMTLVSTVASFGMTSLWAWLLGHDLIAGEGTKDPAQNIDIQYHMIAISLLSFTIPIALGVLFKYKWASKAEQTHRLIAKPFYMVCLIVFPVVGMYNSTFLFYLMSWRHVLVGFLVGNLGYVFGAGFAALCCQRKPQVIAISLETALQNAGIPFVVLNLNFASPYSDVGSLPVIAYFLCSTGPILFPMYALHLTYQCYTGQTSISQIREDFRKKKAAAKPKFTENGKSMPKEAENGESIELVTRQLGGGSDGAKPGLPNGGNGVNTALTCAETELE